MKNGCLAFLVLLTTLLPSLASATEVNSLPPMKISGTIEVAGLQQQQLQSPNTPPVIAGGVFAEKIGEAGRATLREFTGIEAHLLMGGRDGLELPQNKKQLIVPDDAESVMYFPILYKWPELPASAAREIAELLLRNDSYDRVIPMDESYESPTRDDRLLGLVFRNEKTELAVVYQSPWVEYYTNHKEKGWISSDQFILTDEANQQLQYLMAAYLPQDGAMEAAVSDKLAEWNRIAKRRLQDTEFNESVTSPVKITAIWQGRGAIQFEWENDEQHPILIVRSDKREFRAIPDHDTRYSVGDEVGDARVVYSGSGASHLDQGLRDEHYYYYKSYAHSSRGYSSSNVIRLSSGDGIRNMDANTLSEFQVDDPEQNSNLPHEEYGFHGPSGIIMYGSSFLTRLIGEPGHKQVELQMGEQKFIAPEDDHPPVGGAGSYTARIRYGSN